MNNYFCILNCNLYIGWTGDLSRVNPAFAQCQLGSAPAPHNPHENCPGSWRITHLSHTTHYLKSHMLLSVHLFPTHMILGYIQFEIVCNLILLCYKCDILIVPFNVLFKVQCVNIYSNSLCIFYIELFSMLNRDRHLWHTGTICVHLFILYAAYQPIAFLSCITILIEKQSIIFLDLVFCKYPIWNPVVEQHIG